MKRIAVLAFAAAAWCAGAEEIELKGARLGMKKPEVVAMFPALTCLSSCYYENKIRNGRGPQFSPLMTFAGAHALEWWFHFDKEESLSRVTIRLAPFALTPILAGLTEKYGAPKSREESEAQTMSGAKFAKTEVAWEIGDSRLRVASPSGKITEMEVKLTSIKGDAEAIEKAKAKAKTDL